MTQSELEQLVISTVAQVSPKLRGRIGPETALIGGGAPLSSVEFVTALMALEENLGAVDMSAAFLETSSLPDEESPFHTVRSLSGYLAARSNTR